MKRINIFRAFTFLFIGSLFIASCEKSEAVIDVSEKESQEEGFNSVTGNSDSASEETSEVLSPVLHLKYDAAMSKEDVEAASEMEVAKYIKENKSTAKSTEWFYKVQTNTGTQSHNDTDGNVWARVNFLTDVGHRHLSWMKLDHAWPYNDHEGGWGVYLFKSTIQNPSIGWLEAENANLALQGTDGWYVKNFDIHVHTSYQSGSASGSTHVFSSPEIWLDNSTSSGWDYYYTGNVGSGRMNFN